MTVRSQYLEVRPKVAVDGCGFRRRFYNEKFYDLILMIKMVKTTLCDPYRLFY